MRCGRLSAAPPRTGALASLTGCLRWRLQAGGSSMDLDGVDLNAVLDSIASTSDQGVAAASSLGFLEASMDGTPLDLDLDAPEWWGLPCATAQDYAGHFASLAQDGASHFDWLA